MTLFRFTKRGYSPSGFIITRPLLLFFIILFLDNLNAQINKINPEWVTNISVDSILPVNKTLVKDGYYYVLVDEQFNTIKRHNYFHYATTAITEEALTNVSQIEFSYDPAYQKGFLHCVKIHRGKTVIDKISSLELKTLNEEKERDNGILNGKKTIYTNLSDVRKGDIVEYSYSIIGKNPILGDFFSYNFSLAYSVPVGKIFSRLIFSKEVKPNILYKNTKLKPQISTGNNFNDYVWQVNNPAIQTTESSTPGWYRPFAHIQISNIADWKTVKDHCNSLFTLPKYNSTELKQIVDSIVKSTEDIESQITSIIEFVQTHIRYSGNENGIYSHIPRTPELVLKNRYGDCKEKSVLMNEMLKLIKIEAHPVLINSYMGSKVKEEVPSINAFDHCISSFFYDNQLYFIDPTISHQRGPFKYRILPPYEIGLIMDNKTQTFTKIPIDLTSKTNILEEIVIEKSGDAYVKATSKYTGTSADDIRYTFLTNSIYDIQNSYKDYYTKYSKEVEVVDTLTYTDNTEINEFTLVENYLLKKFWGIPDSSKSKTISKDFVPYSLHERLNYGEESKRKDPLKLKYPANIQQTIIVKKEGGWDVAEKTKEEKNKYFDYSYISLTKGDALHLIYNYTCKMNVIEAKDYLDYKSKMDFINYNIVFSAEEKPQAEGIVGFNWVLLCTILIALIFSVFLFRFLFKREYTTNYVPIYDSIGGWLVLVAIGVTITPLILLYSLYNQTSDEMGINYFVYYFDVKSSYFAPMKGYFSLFVTFVNTLLLTFSVLLLIVFYQKKSSFRPYYCIFRIFDTVFLIFNLIILYSFYGESSNLDERKLLSTETSGTIRVFIQTCIWVPYIWLSERSRHTFTNSNKTQFPTKENAASPDSPENQKINL